MKYIIFKNKDGWDIPILFPDVITHKEMAGKFPDMKPMNAGFFTCNTEYVSMSGHSLSLNLESSPNDKRILEREADFYN